jgi:hypothetical protein
MTSALLFLLASLPPSFRTPKSQLSPRTKNVSIPKMDGIRMQHDLVQDNGIVDFQT